MAFRENCYHTRRLYQMNTPSQLVIDDIETEGIGSEGSLKSFYKCSVNLFVPIQHLHFSAQQRMTWKMISVIQKNKKNNIEYSDHKNKITLDFEKIKKEVMKLT